MFITNILRRYIMADGKWITVNGRHILLQDGESPKDAINRSIAEKNEDIKEQQIARAKKEADRLNGKKELPDPNRVDPKVVKAHHKRMEQTYLKYYDGSSESFNKVLVELGKIERQLEADGKMTEAEILTANENFNFSKLASMVSKHRTNKHNKQS